MRKDRYFQRIQHDHFNKFLLNFHWCWVQMKLLLLRLIHRIWEAVCIQMFEKSVLNKYLQNTKN